MYQHIRMKDRVEVDLGTVVINGKRLEEAYVPQEYRDETSMAQRVIPPDEFFVLGIIAVLQTIAVLGAWCRAALSTARRYSSTGPWTN